MSVANVQQQTELNRRLASVCHRVLATDLAQGLGQLGAHPSLLKQPAIASIFSKVAAMEYSNTIDFQTDFSLFFAASAREGVPVTAVRAVFQAECTRLLGGRGKRPKHKQRQGGQGADNTRYTYDALQLRPPGKLPRGAVKATPFAGGAGQVVQHMCEVMLSATHPAPPLRPSSSSSSSSSTGPDTIDRAFLNLGYCLNGAFEAGLRGGATHGGGKYQEEPRRRWRSERETKEYERAVEARALLEAEERGGQAGEQGEQGAGGGSKGSSMSLKLSSAGGADSAKGGSGSGHASSKDKTKDKTKDKSKDKGGSSSSSGKQGGGGGSKRSIAAAEGRKQKQLQLVIQQQQRQQQQAGSSRGGVGPGNRSGASKTGSGSRSGSGSKKGTKSKKRSLAETGCKGGSSAVGDTAGAAAAVGDTVAASKIRIRKRHLCACWHLQYQEVCVDASLCNPMMLAKRLKGRLKGRNVECFCCNESMPYSDFISHAGGLPKEAQGLRPLKVLLLANTHEPVDSHRSKCDVRWYQCRTCGECELPGFPMARCGGCGTYAHEGEKCPSLADHMKLRPQAGAGGTAGGGTASSEGVGGGGEEGKEERKEEIDLAPRTCKYCAHLQDADDDDGWEDGALAGLGLATAEGGAGEARGPASTPTAGDGIGLDAGSNSTSKRKRKSAKRSEFVW